MELCRSCKDQAGTYSHAVLLRLICMYARLRVGTKLGTIQLG